MGDMQPVNVKLKVLSSPNKLKLEFTIPHLYDVLNQDVYD